MDKYAVTVGTFNKLAEQYEAKYMDFDFYFDTYEKLIELIQNDRAKILDIACGPGNITKFLLSKMSSYQVLGIDLAPNMVDLARKNNPTADF